MSDWIDTLLWGGYNQFFKVFKVPETKGISLNDFDEIIGSFQFGVGIRQFHGV